MTSVQGVSEGLWETNRLYGQHSMLNSVSVLETITAFLSNYHKLSWEQLMTSICINNKWIYKKPELSVQENKLFHLYIIILANKIYIDEKQQ